MKITKKVGGFQYGYGSDYIYQLYENNKKNLIKLLWKIK
jgi:hypothetical protein